MENSVSIEFNQDELNALTQLLDVSVKSTGLQGAKIALHFINKIESAISLGNTKHDVIEDSAAA